LQRSVASPSEMGWLAGTAPVVGTEVCNAPAAPGPCRGSFTRYYYDAALRRCEAFMYGGCRGNDNRFETVADCRRMCAHRPDTARSECHCLLSDQIYSNMTILTMRVVQIACLLE